MAAGLRYEQIRDSAPEYTRRLLQWVLSKDSLELPADATHSDVVDILCQALSVERHTCTFNPVGGLGDYRICWGCGEVVTEVEWKNAFGADGDGL